MEHYRKGLIPGPLESREQFFQRVARLQEKKEPVGKAISAEDWAKAHDVTRSLYGIAPDWIAAFFSHRDLFWWEAGAMWELEDGFAIQLNDKQRRVAHVEVLAHEMVHAARAAFRESRFEELLAYRTSPNRWRRWIGPLFRHPKETWGLMAAILIDMWLIWHGNLPWGTSGLFAVMGGRLAWDQWRLASCLKRLPLASIGLCLTDQEIVAVAKGTSWIELDDGSLRWQMIKVCANGPSVGEGHSGT
ncbi:MAG: hypothetical protein KGZ39_07315 [Simkania sp.]|nr:hypothetical protein [Simkania sp.]